MTGYPRIVKVHDDVLICRRPTVPLSSDFIVAAKVVTNLMIKMGSRAVTQIFLAVLFIGGVMSTSSPEEIKHVSYRYQTFTNLDYDDLTVAALTPPIIVN